MRVSQKRTQIRHGGGYLFNGLVWVPVHPGATFDMLGYIPAFLSFDDKRPAAEQIAANYKHCGGWTPFKGFEIWEVNRLKYPGDPPIAPLFRSKLRDEDLWFYQHAWFRIVQPDGTWEVCRLD